MSHRSQETGLPVSVRIRVGDRIFHLHKVKDNFGNISVDVLSSIIFFPLSKHPTFLFIFNSRSKEDRNENIKF